MWFASPHFEIRIRGLMRALLRSGGGNVARRDARTANSGSFQPGQIEAVAKGPLRQAFSDVSASWMWSVGELVLQCLPNTTRVSQRDRPRLGATLVVESVNLKHGLATFAGAIQIQLSDEQPGIRTVSPGAADQTLSFGLFSPFLKSQRQFHQIQSLDGHGRQPTDFRYIGIEQESSLPRIHECAESLCLHGAPVRIPLALQIGVGRIYNLSHKGDSGM